MAGKGQKYPKEFKDSAIQLALNSEKSVIKIADELGVHEKTLYGWLSKYRRANNLENLVTNSKKSQEKESLEEENRRLRKELVNVKKDREILKKAAAPQEYFLATLTARISPKSLSKIRMGKRA